MQASDIRRIAVEASCDPRTVRAFLKGEANMGGLAASRIEAAMKKLDLKIPEPSSEETSSEASVAKRKSA